MKADAVIRLEAIDALIATLGKVDAERFISIIGRDKFDYTEWRPNNLCRGMSFDEAVAYEKRLKV